MRQLFLIAVLTAFACHSNNTLPEEDRMETKNYSLESFEVVEKSGTEKKAIFLLKGYLPNPAYSLRDVKIERQGEKVVVVPEIDYDPNKVVIQVAVPFEKKVVIDKIEKPCDIIIGGKTLYHRFSVE